MSRLKVKDMAMLCFRRCFFWLNNSLEKEITIQYLFTVLVIYSTITHGNYKWPTKLTPSNLSTARVFRPIYRHPCRSSYSGPTFSCNHKADSCLGRFYLLSSWFMRMTWVSQHLMWKRCRRITLIDQLMHQQNWSTKCADGLQSAHQRWQSVFLFIVYLMDSGVNSMEMGFIHCTWYYNGFASIWQVRAVSRSSKTWKIPTAKPFNASVMIRVRKKTK